MRISYDPGKLFGYVGLWASTFIIYDLFLFKVVTFQYKSPDCLV